MAACPKCGSVVPEGAAFCSICGSSVSAIGSPVPPPPPRPQAANAGMTSNVAGALAYLLGIVTGIIFLVLEPYKTDRFVRFHAFQSIFLFVAAVVFRIIWGGFLLGMFYSIGFLGSLFYFVGSLVYFGFFLLWLFMMYKAYNNEMYKLPVIGDLASKQAAQ